MSLCSIVVIFVFIICDGALLYTGNTNISKMKGEFDLNWLDNRAEVTKYGNDSTVKISKDSKRVIIKLNEKRNEASMTVNRDEVYKFLVSPRLEILSKDEKFMRWLDENKKKFDDKYEELVKSV
ncbi:MAG: hypothetical protein QOK82_02495 [Nitrososphaeraceae archaeon]|nr:hypothetical protein [Nitrososphaeraceae archaeon]MDW0170700.1 hypothetical protein [Nitrososphaeraceae archaeon]